MMILFNYISLPLLSEKAIAKHLITVQFESFDLKLDLLVENNLAIAVEAMVP